MKILHLMAGLGESSGVANVARRFARVQRERSDGVLMLAPSCKWNPIYFGLVFALRAWRAARTADEIWVHCSWTFPVWFGALLAKAYGRKLVVVPEASFDPQRLNNHAGWKKRLVAPLDRWVLRRANEVLALCPEEIDWVRTFEPKAPVRFERVPTFYEDVKQSVEIHRPAHVLFLGRANDPLKGARFLRRAVDEIHAETSVRVELRIESAVFGAEKEKAWEWCDVLCLPTLSDNFGLVVAEALEHGKQVITTDGAPAWADEPRVVYLRGFREGPDEKRVGLLVEALKNLARRML